ncbi:1-acyl-sn-glycerol-3-phosphate acyltransferase ['Fragaria x ananassa' phyllody phytoplasma]|uniref:1-acyl-sn-glycerol-3-phosphate acyltransferase n=1 Tax='Fragaria x ananassa' phyllody phytoplasma TaxID=2358428 RepID=A0ABS5K2T5_9MOLU|nr:lysophospholipid acyltransferase family protein ['Fragaria x ananassa' phyllody phytoplasma]MBS2126203.1 1-acyl-sn-glycerol-3-phosphate acyltransferase ['Fragaria x ananassa' phyllody phytoplasma]
MFILIFIIIWPLATFSLFKILWLNSFYFFPCYLLLAFLLSFLVIFLVLLLSLVLMSFLPPNHRFKGFIITSISNFIKCFLRIKIIVKNFHLLPLDKNIVIYANHKSHIDPFVIASALAPRTVAFSPKDKFRSFLGSQLFLKLAFYASDCMVIVRSDIRKTASNLFQAVSKIKTGLAMVIFPEGGIKDRNNEQAVPLLGGAFKIAFKSQADIVPVTIKGASRIKNYFWWQQKTIEVIIHSPLEYRRYQEQKMPELVVNVQQIINSGLK